MPIWRCCAICLMKTLIEVFIFFLFSLLVRGKRDSSSFPSWLVYRCTVFYVLLLYYLIPKNVFVGYCLKKLWSGPTKLSSICIFFPFFQECIACYQFIFFEQLEVSFAKCSITVYANTAECFLNLLFQSCIGVAVSLRIIWCIIVSPISQGHYLYYLLCT